MLGACVHACVSMCVRTCMCACICACVNGHLRPAVDLVAHIHDERLCQVLQQPMQQRWIAHHNLLRLHAMPACPNDLSKLALRR